MKRLDYTYSMLITAILAAVATYFIMADYFNQSKVDKAEKIIIAKQLEIKSEAESKAKTQANFKTDKSKDYKVSQRILVKLSIQLLLINNSLSKLSQFEIKKSEFIANRKRFDLELAAIANQINVLTKLKPDLANEINVAYLKMQQQRVLAESEVVHLQNLSVHLTAINKVIVELNKDSRTLLNLMLVQFNKAASRIQASTIQASTIESSTRKNASVIQKLSFQLLYLERIENLLNRAIRFNIKVKNPEVLIDRAKRDLAVFVTVVEGFIAGNATQGIEVLTGTAELAILAKIKKNIPILENNLKPLIDSRLRIEKLKSSVKLFYKVNLSLFKIINKVER